MSAPTYLLLLQYQAVPYVHRSGPASGTLLSGAGNGLVLDARQGRVLSMSDFSTTFEGSQTNWGVYSGAHTDTTAGRFVAPVVQAYSGVFNTGVLHTQVDDFLMQVDVVSSPSAMRSDVEVYFDFAIGGDTYELLSSGGQVGANVVPAGGSAIEVGHFTQVDPSGYTWRIAVQGGRVYFYIKAFNASLWTTVASTPLTTASLADRRSITGGFGAGYWNTPITTFPNTTFDNFMIRESYSAFTLPATQVNVRSDGAISSAAAAGLIFDRAAGLVWTGGPASGVPISASDAGVPRDASTGGS